MSFPCSCPLLPLISPDYPRWSSQANPHALKPTATRPQFKAETVPPEAKAKNRNEPPDGEMGAEQKLLGLLAKEEAEEAAWELTADKQQSIASEGAAESISAPDGGASIDGEMVGCGEAAKAKGAIVVTRREARNMTDVEQERFAKAVLHMMERHNGASTSEYFRIAGLHGYPSDHCHLAQETFPGWHRLYLVEFEQALRAADRALGNDGNIGCPYWDWTRDEANGQVLPALARRYFERVPQVRPLPRPPPDPPGRSCIDPPLSSSVQQGHTPPSSPQATLPAVSLPPPHRLLHAPFPRPLLPPHLPSHAGSPLTPPHTPCIPRQGLLEDLGDRASMFPGGCYRRRSEKQLLARLRASEVIPSPALLPPRTLSCCSVEPSPCHLIAVLPAHCLSLFSWPSPSPARCTSPSPLFAGRDCQHGTRPRHAGLRADAAVPRGAAALEACLHQMGRQVKH